ncbi:MAG: AAA family ATPase [Gammaproteobacteria bacterium]|nr:AAA family ATPase [Gammaproteobacteria bacterium]
MEDTYNLAFERSILSSLIFEPSQLAEISKSLSVDHFYLEAHKDIYKAITNLVLADKPIDEEFIRSELNRVGRFNESIMVEILTANPIANIHPYIDELAKFRDRRTLLSLSTQFKYAAESEDPIHAAKELIVALEEGMSIDRRLPAPKNHETIEEKEAEFILKDWLPIPKSTVSLVTAPGGSGKTWTILQIAARYCLSEKNAKAFLWLSEDPISLSKARLNKILDKVIKTSQNGIKIDLAGDATPMLLNVVHNKVTVDPIWHDLKKVFDPYDLIILDPLIAFFGGDENNNGHARFFMQLFTEYAGKTGKTIIFIHHSTKGTAGSRGAGAIVDAARLHYEVDRVRDKDGKIDEKKSHMRLIRLAKDNYNAGSLLKSSEVERQIFPQTSPMDHIEIAYLPGDF